MVTPILKHFQSFMYDKTTIREKTNNLVLVNPQTSNSSTLNFSVLYATPPTMGSKTCLSTTTPIESSEPVHTSNLDIKCEPLAVHFDPWQVPSVTGGALRPLPSNQDSIVRSIKTPLSASVIHPPPTIESVNITKCEMKKSSFSGDGLN